MYAFIFFSLYFWVFVSNSYIIEILKMLNNHLTDSFTILHAISIHVYK